MLKASQGRASPVLDLLYEAWEAELCLGHLSIPCNGQVHFTELSVISR